MISNLSLLFLAIAKAALYTGFGPGIVVLGLYNFQKCFVPKVLSGEKTHTIRALRSNPDKPGNVLHLYTGLRQKGARLLMRVLCVKVEEISIDCRSGDPSHCRLEIDGQFLDRSEKEALARRDGFANFADMMAFWRGRLPFKGHILHWKTESTLIPAQNIASSSPPRKVRHA